MSQETLIDRETPEQWIAKARERWSPIRTFCLFSGGNDSGVLAHRCRDDYDVLLFIDTGLAVPGVEGHVIRFAKWLDKPLMTVRSGAAYREMVLGGRMMSNGRREPANGFPGKGLHGRAYTRLKERRIEDVVRCTKLGHPRSAAVLFLSGVRRDESTRRSKRQPLTEHHSAKYCNPLIEWTNAEMRDYREEHELPESDVAALLHRSGECNCGAFADAESERAMLKSLWPEWWSSTIEPLEAEAEERGIRWCRWGGYDLDGNQAAGSEPEPGLLCSDCPRQLALTASTQPETRREIVARETIHRVNVNFSEGAYHDLEEIARTRGKTKAEVLRDAIALERWFDEARREGARILIERPGGELRELIPR